LILFWKVPHVSYLFIGLTLLLSPIIGAFLYAYNDYLPSSFGVYRAASFNWFIMPYIRLDSAAYGLLMALFYKRQKWFSHHARRKDREKERCLQYLNHNSSAVPFLLLTYLTLTVYALYYVIWLTDIEYQEDYSVFNAIYMGTARVAFHIGMCAMVAALILGHADLIKLFLSNYLF